MKKIPTHSKTTSKTTPQAPAKSAAPKARPIIYFIVGLTITAFNFGAYTFIARLLIQNNDYLWLSNLIATFLSTILAFILHSRITWKDRQITKLNIIKFFAWNALLTFIISPLFTWLFSLFGDLYHFAYDITTAMHLPFDYNFIQSTGAFVLTSVVVMVINYFFYDRFVFPRQSTSSKTSSSFWQNFLSKTKSSLHFWQKLTPATKTFLIFAIICLLIKIALVSWRSIYAIPNAASDDGLMQKGAINLLEFQWFGAFDAYTLSKTNIFSFYLAALNTFGIPFLIGSEILFFIATLIIVFLLKKYVHNKWFPYLVFSFIFFNPATFATATSVRIYRDAIYPSIILICLGSLFHIFTNIKNQKPYNAWLAVYTISLTFFWFLREESVWILPILIFCSLFIIFFINKYQSPPARKKSILKFLLIPPAAILIVWLGFKTANFIAYNSFVLTESDSSGYQDFYNAVNKISSSERTDTIDFPTDVRYQIYDVSPTFSTIKDSLENTVFPTIKLLGDNPEEINSGWTTWAIRQAMARHGYYDSATSANNFYSQVATEINAACDDTKLDCTYKKPGLVSTLLSNIPRLFSEIFSNLRFAYTFSGTEIRQYYSEPTPVSLGEAAEILTKENILSASDGIRENPADPTRYTKIDKLKIKLLAIIRKAYQIASPVLFWVSVILFVILSIKYLFCTKDGRKFYERPHFDLIAFSASILVALLIRCLIVAYLNISSFYATSDLYLYVCYSLVLVFIACIFTLTIISISDTIKKRSKNEKRHR